MKSIKIKYVAFLSVLLVAGACHDLDELNINPNGPAPETTDLNLLLPTAITDLGQNVVNMGFGDIAGVMQHTQKNGWSGGHNDYDWNVTSKSWAGLYGVLRNADEIYNKAVDGGYEFHQGAALVLKAYAFGLIADLWGDAPYSEALKAQQGPQFFEPVYDPQQEIYHGILADLESANTLLSKDASDYKNIAADQDLLYHGDPAKWRQFANSLALRYYMRLQAKEGSFAQAGIEKITSDPANYPLITSASDDANVAYAGTSQDTSWPTNMVYNIDPLGEYTRRKMCSTLVEALQALDDPRLGVWAEKVEIPLVLVTGQGEDIDRIVNGKREISPDVAQDYIDRWSAAGETLEVDYDQEYVGVPPSTQAAQFYNLTPNLNQGSYNP
ncbi:MAG TPA: SusD/RagB family nutrient-binding outer membrane lipoprotein, partial [Chryseosolibacter sp.]|nr:SusD/RagB family nutrient-binding outer membrane lipoprotein [Chryseosolibacter sp.]